MSGRAAAEVSGARWRTVWRKHDDGMAARAIARDIAVGEHTVRYYLAKGRPASVPAPLPRHNAAPQARRSGADSDAPGGAAVAHLADRRRRA